MTVEELIAELQLLPQDAEVHFSYNYGDHWHTQVAPKAHEVYEGVVGYSDYHRMHKVIEDHEDDDKVSHVVIIG